MPVVLLCHFDGTNGQTTTVDSSPAAHALSFSAGITLSTTQAKFGATSLDLSGGGASGCVQTPDSADWAFGSGQFTVELWVQYKSAHGTGNHAFLSQWQANTGWYLGQGNSGQLTFIWSTTGSDTPLIGAAWNPNIGQWYHVAADRDASNVLRLYLDGVVVASSTVAATFFDSSAPLYIGSGNGSIANPIPAYVDEARIVKGQAMYGGAFTPPSLPFPTIASISGLIRESLYSGTAAIRTSGLVREVLRSTGTSGATSILVSGLVREVLRASPPAAGGATVQARAMVLA